MPYIPKLEFANFHLTLGDSINLLDVFPFVVFPALRDEQYKRTYGETSYWFEDLQIIKSKVGPVDTPLLAGRLRKKHVVELQTEDLSEEAAQVVSTESSLFVLLLDSHRLLYLQETQQAPGLQAFKTTVEQCVRAKYDYLLKLCKSEFETEGTSQTWNILLNPPLPDPGRPALTRLRKLFPKPQLSVVQLSNDDSVEEFLKRFSLLQTVEFDLIRTNQELSNSAIVRGIKDQGAALGAQDTGLTFSNPNGLERDAVLENFGEIFQQGTVSYTFRGKDDKSRPLTGTPENFGYRIPLKELVTRRNFLSSVFVMLSQFVSSITSGALQVPVITRSESQKALDAVASLEIVELNDENDS